MNLKKMNDVRNRLAKYWPFRFTIGNVNVSVRKVEGMEDAL